MNELIKYEPCLEQYYGDSAEMEKAEDSESDYEVYYSVKEVNENIAELKARVKFLNNKIDDAHSCLVCAAIADPMEICRNTIKILLNTG